jgi:hypothetical protein
MSGLKNKSYQEAADDVYVDLIRDLEILKEEIDEDVVDGIDVALELVKSKRGEMYG